MVERLGGLARCSISKSIWNIRSVMGAIPREVSLILVVPVLFDASCSGAE